ncbi:MAG: hypothetical protein K2X87_21570 [Gemmataceae bacterium]|nr:hypothetical protein [Gemmataceae bacterium]
MTALRLLLFSAAFLLTAGAWAADDSEQLTVDFGKKDEGKPKSTKPSHVVASGRVVLSKDYTDPKVEVLIRSDPVDPNDPGWAVHTAKLKDGKWTIDIPKLPPGTYRVWLRCKLTRVADEAGTELYFPDDPEKSPYPYTVTVK